MNKNFLDYTGLTKYTEKIEAFITSKVAGLVPQTRKVNAKALTEDINLTAYDIDAVPITREINGHQLGFDLILTAKDLNAVPTSRTVNGKPLSEDITLTASDIGVTTPDLSGYVPTSRTVNGKALTSDITLSAEDIGVSAGVGKSLAGMSVKVTSDDTVTAGNGAEIFNDYETRSYSGKDIVGGNVASGQWSHAEGFRSTATGLASHAEGELTTASAYASHAEGFKVISSGAYSHAEGDRTDASGDISHAEGDRTDASGDTSHAEGYRTAASGDASHAEGWYTTASGDASHAEGDRTTASGNNSHAEGYYTTASGDASHAEGSDTKATGNYSHAEGYYTEASNYASHASGKYSKAMTTGAKDSDTIGDVFVVGNGTGSSAKSNALRLAYEGTLYLTKAYKSTGADYAEYFEWLDGNPNAEDRVGRFVTLEGNKIKIAEPGDYILGVVSGQPCIIGNADEDWLGRWEHDNFNRFVKEYLVHNEVEVTSEEFHSWFVDNSIQERDGQYFKMETQVVDYPTNSWRHKANPNYDPSQPYIERKDRQEWDAVGMVGVLSVIDDGTCEVNSYAKVSQDGVATDAASYIPRQTFRVVSRVTNNVIKILLL